MSALLHIMHYPCFHYYIVFTIYYHYYPFLPVTNGATCRCGCNRHHFSIPLQNFLQTPPLFSKTPPLFSKPPAATLRRGGGAQAAFRRRGGGVDAAWRAWRRRGGGVEAAWQLRGGSAVAECSGLGATLWRRGGGMGAAWRRHGAAQPGG